MGRKHNTGEIEKESERERERELTGKKDGVGTKIRTFSQHLMET